MSAPCPADLPTAPGVPRTGAAPLRADLRAILALAAPLFLNSSLQALLNLTDTWFLGRLSTHATAAVGAVYWFVVVTSLLLGGVGMAVQTLVAQATGAGAHRHAVAAAWTGLWAALATVPAFLAAALAGPLVLRHAGLPADLAALAGQFWVPRVAGGAAGVGLWVITSYYNGSGRTRVTLLLMTLVAGGNALLNQCFIFGLGLGIAGSGWATTGAQLLGVGAGLVLFLGADPAARSTWRTSVRALGRLFGLGLPMGLAPAVDVGGLAAFQLMQAHLGNVAGAATQVVMMLTSLAYMPAVGLAIAGTTLVGQAIGAGHPEQAWRLGNRIVLLAAGYMGAVGLVLAIGGTALVPLFLGAADPDAAAVAALARRLLWLAAAYQFFDGLNLGSAFCLRGAGDVRLPTLILLGLSWGLFVPLAHALTFAPGQGFLPWLPHLGLGAMGGWSAALAYTVLLGGSLLWRWRSRAWMRIGPLRLDR